MSDDTVANRITPEISDEPNKILPVIYSAVIKLTVHIFLYRLIWLKYKSDR